MALKMLSARRQALAHNLILGIISKMFRKNSPSGRQETIKREAIGKLIKLLNV